MPTYCDCESLQKRIEELEAKLRDVPWTEEDVLVAYTDHKIACRRLGLVADYQSDYQEWAAALQFAEKRIKEREL